MYHLDVRTVLVCNIATSLASALIMLLLWRQVRERFAGTHLWALDFALQTAGVMLIAMRGTIWDAISIVIANGLVAGGTVVLYLGMEQFMGRPSRGRHNYLILAAFVAFQAYFTYLHPSLQARNINLSVLLLIICGQCAWLMLKGYGSGFRSAGFLPGLVLVGFSLFSLARIVLLLSGYKSGADYMHGGVTESFILISYQMLSLLLTYALVLMVNRRLSTEISSQEQIFAVAFRSAPYAILLTSVDNGEILDINTGFEKYTGFSRAEALGRTTLDLKLWLTEQERHSIIEMLGKGHQVSGREISFRMKNGQIMHTLFTAEIVSVNGRPSVLSSIIDITEMQGNRDLLSRQVAEMKAMNTAMLDREDRVRELKSQVAELKQKLGNQSPQKVQEASGS